MREISQRDSDLHILRSENAYRDAARIFDVRLGLACIVLIFIASNAQAAEPAILYREDRGHLVLGPTGPLVGEPALEGVAYADLAIQVDACHTELRIAIDWRPGEHGVRVGSQGATVATVIRAEVIASNGSAVPGGSGSFPGGWGSLQVRVPESQDYVLRLSLEFGANVDYHVKIFGWVPPTPPAGCGPS